MSDLVLIRVNCPTPEVADTIAIALVNERLAACANIEPPVTSIYVWDGRLDSTREHVVILKSRASLFAACSERIRALHPHEVPAILALPVVDVDAGFAQWVVDNTRV